MGKEFLRQSTPLGLLECLIKAQQPPASFQTIARHLQFIHRVDVLHMKLDARSIWRFCYPHVQIFMSACFEIQRVIAVMEVSKFREKSELIL